MKRNFAVFAVPLGKAQITDAMQEVAGELLSHDLSFTVWYSEPERPLVHGTSYLTIERDGNVGTVGTDHFGFWYVSAPIAPSRQNGSGMFIPVRRGETADETRPRTLDEVVTACVAATEPLMVNAIVGRQQNHGWKQYDWLKRRNRLVQVVKDIDA